MKSGIHPEYMMATVTCACGNTFQTRATRSEVRLEICSACHPHYTGIQKMMDTAGRVERFQKRFASTDGKTVERAKKAAPAAIKAPAISTKTKPKVLGTAPVAGKKDDKKGAKAAKKA